MLTLPCCLPSAEMEAQSQKGFQDPLSAVPNESETTATLPLDKPTGPEAPVNTDSPTPSLNQPNGKEGNEGSEVVDLDKNDATDSSSAWSPEVLQPEIERQMRSKSYIFC